LNLTFDQILALVEQLSGQEKLKLASVLEEELINSKLSGLLKTFRTDELDLKTLSDEIETVRKEIYERGKQKGHL